MTSWSPLPAYLLPLLLVPAAWLDVTRRTVPALFGPAALLCSLALLLWEGASVALDSVALACGVLAVLFLIASAVGAVGWVDAAVGLAAILGVAGVNTAARPAALLLLVCGTAGAGALFYGARASRSIRQYGAPRNGWDVVAMFYRRVDLGPEPGAGRRHDSELIQHVEAFRSPDDRRLERDPCPLVTCLAVGVWVMTLAS